MTLATLRSLSDKIHADRLKIERCWCNVRVRDGESEIAYIETYGAESDNGEEEIQGAYIAAGTTVTHDVPKGALCVGRAKEKNIEGWVARRGLLDKKK